MSAEHWIQVVIYDQPGAPDDSELKDTVSNLAHVLEKQDGYQDGFWGRDPDDGAYASVTQWAGPEAIEAGHAALAGMLSAAATRGIRIVDRQSIQLFTPPPSIAVWFDDDHRGVGPERKGLFRRHR
jgi:heme-degrading monooxygenase HmoA